MAPHAHTAARERTHFRQQAILRFRKKESQSRGGDHLPKTIIKATRYGRGKVRLKESSSGSTAGSPSIAAKEEDVSLVFLVFFRKKIELANEEKKS